MPLHRMKLEPLPVWLWGLCAFVEGGIILDHQYFRRQVTSRGNVAHRLQLAETAAEGDVLLDSRVLIAPQQNKMFRPGSVDDG